MDAEPDTELKAIISQVIEEEDAQKTRSKQAKARLEEGDPTTKGEQDDAVEGDVANDNPDVDPDGPIKEHLLSEVHKRRGQKRKERTFGNDEDSERLLVDCDAPAAVTEQQEGQFQDDDGPVLAAFNMDEAEQEEAGLGGEKKGEEEEDAWLQSLEEQKPDPSKASTSSGAGKEAADIDGASNKVTDAIREKHEAQQKILDSNEPLSDAEITSARNLLLQHLLPREKVMQALARLSSERSTNDPTIKARDRVGSKRVKQSKPVIIDALTDAATSLMTEDADAFELTREEIAHALQISQVVAEPLSLPVGRAADGGEKSDGDDEDMFAESDDEKQLTRKEGTEAPKNPAAAAESNISAAAAEPSGAAASGQGAGQAKPSVVPTSDGGADVGGQSANDEGQQGTVPLGFILDRTSGYYMHPESGWYYHLESRCYYRNGNWYAAGAVPAEPA